MGVPVAEVAGSAEEWNTIVDAIGEEMPVGFRAMTTSLDFHPRELPTMDAKMNMGAIVSDVDLELAAVYTSNAVCGAPVTIGRRAMSESWEGVRGVLVNNKISNVRPSSGTGEEDALAVCEACAKSLGVDGKLLPASTGVIGWALPVDEMIAAANEGWIEGTSTDVARAMMTTDRYPKIARATMSTGGSVVGVVKGAGMIEPELCATMLCFVLTDVKLPREKMQGVLERVSDATLSCIGVDGDESTSDMVVLMSSGLADRGEEDDECKREEEFEEKVGEVVAQLAHHLVRNGEGTNHVVRLSLTTDELSFRQEKDLARSVLNGPLLKCAIAGNDANVGRLMQKLGQELGRLSRRSTDVDAEKLLSLARVEFGRETIYEHGNFQLDPEKEKRIVKHLRDAQLGPDAIGLPGESSGDAFPIHGECVEIRVDLRADKSVPAKHPTIVLGSDLTHQYVTENADYRS